MDRRNFLGTSSLGAATLAPLVLATASAAAAAPGPALPAAGSASDAGQRTREANSYLDMLDRNKAVLLIADHQVGLYTGVRDIGVGDLKHNVVALARAVRVLGVPVVLTGTMTDGMWGPIIPELQSALPDVKPIVRTVINAWDDPRVVSAIGSTGRRQLLVAGVSLEVCAAYPALSAKAAGYDARVVLDASGTFNEAKRAAGLQRLAGAGVPVMDYAGVAVEMLRDNMDPNAGKVYGALDIPFVSLVSQMASAGARK